jgi:phosphatidate cytidylyltransferase
LKTIQKELEVLEQDNQMDKHNLFIRALSGTILAIIFLISILLFRPLFYVLIYLMAALMFFEWFAMTGGSNKYNLLGQIIIVPAIVSLLMISDLDESGWVLTTLFITIASVDVMAMFGGKIIKGIKLAPKISPNKTVSGLLVGTSSACIVINLLTLIPSFKLPNMLHENHLSLTLYIFALGILAQISDLFISYFKRKFKIKDTGAIIPGHGGVLDRFDGLILTTPLIILYLISHL